MHSPTAVVVCSLPDFHSLFRLIATTIKAISTVTIIIITIMIAGITMAAVLISVPLSLVSEFLAGT